MKLSEVFSSLLSAEDQAVGNVDDAKNEAEGLRRNAHKTFEDKRSTTLDSAHANARAIVDGARQRGDKEAFEILNAGESERKKISEFFEVNAEGLMESLANEVAEGYTVRARCGVGDAIIDVPRRRVKKGTSKQAGDPNSVPFRADGKVDT